MIRNILNLFTLLFLFLVRKSKNSRHDQQSLNKIYKCTNVLIIILCSQYRATKEIKDTFYYLKIICTLPNSFHDVFKTFFFYFGYIEVFKIKSQNCGTTEQYSWFAKNGRIFLNSYSYKIHVIFKKVFFS